MGVIHPSKLREGDIAEVFWWSEDQFSRLAPLLPTAREACCRSLIAGWSAASCMFQVRLPWA